MLTRGEAAALFDRRREAWLQEDTGSYLGCWAEDMTFASPIHDPPLEGREAYAQLVEASAAAIRPVSFEVHHVAAVGDVVLAEWTITAVRRDTGAEVSWSGMSRAEYRDGLIVRWREYWDPAEVAPIAAES